MAIPLSRYVRVFVHATFERSSPVTKLREGSPIGHVYRCDRVVEQWFRFEYVGLEFTPLSKPFKTREQAEKGEKYPEPLRKGIGVV